MKKDRKGDSQRASLEVILPGPEASFAYLVHPWPWPQCVWHYHHEYELHLILNAEGQVWVGDYIGPFDSGHLVLAGPDLPHNWTSNSLSAPGQPPQEDHVVHFRPEAFGKDFMGIPEMRAIRALLGRATSGLEFTGATRTKVGQMVMGLGNLDAFSRLLALFELLDCLAHADDVRTLSSASYAPVLSEDATSRINKTLAFVRRNLAEDISLADAAAALRMPPRAFSRFFLRITGRHFLDYLVEIRVGEACNLLQNTDQPITDICFTVGFRNISWFNRKFVSIKGLTPREFRRKCQDRYGPFDPHGDSSRPELMQAVGRK